MHILVINSGSSSIKFSMFSSENGEPKSLYEGEISGIGTSHPQLTFEDAFGENLGNGQNSSPAATPLEAITILVKAVTGPNLPAVEAVGYRVVHPGAHLKAHTKIDSEVLQQLKAAAEFAPLHDPEAVAIITEMMKQFPSVAHYACFDTVFHETMPDAAKLYPLPEDLRARGLRRYGFHGLSCESIVRQLRTHDTAPFPQRLIIAHLGSGCSVTAVVAGKSIDTTMGLTPTGGIVMGTRPGDLDPGIILYLLRQPNATADSVEQMLNHNAGMVALSGQPNDMKAVREAARNGDERARLAIKVFTRSVRKAIGSFAWLMGGVDAIVFAGGIGEHDADTRDDILNGLEEFGLKLNLWLDEEQSGLRLLTDPESKTAVYVVPSKEDRTIATHVIEMSNNPA